jgi:antitoxin HicB
MKRARERQSTGRRSTGADRYLDLPYRVTLVRDMEGNGSGWAAAVEELPGCTSKGSTPEEAVNGLQEAMAAWINAALEEGREIPKPKAADSYSGRLLLRMPRTLHAELARVAEREGASLNQFITDVLASAVGWRVRGGASGANAGAKSSINQVPGAAALTPESQIVPEPEPRSRRLLTAILAANFIVVAFAAVVAALALIVFWL